ncbi:MAG: Gfo/Idh/MocA family oxidoreductase [Candidatus Poribacteria bacterium]|nr:Gfo/Idh/MocA family oxidoreductase [Candidatus Poribacteria bacterium]
MINTAVIGYGYAGRCFHAYLVGLADGLNLYAIASRNAERREAAAEAHPGTKNYETIDQVIEDSHVDLVVFATPHDTHAELAIQAMDAGKHVVTDKIMCMSAAEADAMIEASQRNDVLLSVFHNRRWDWDYLTVRKIIADGLLGVPYLFQVAIMRYGPPRGWRGVKKQSGGLLYDWPAHFVDQALQLVSAPVKTVFCDIHYGTRWDIDIGNYANLLITFENDVRYQIEISNLAKVEKPRWYVLGDFGGLVKCGLDPQERPMVARNIDAAEEDPANYAKVWTEAAGEQRELVVESVRGSWKSYYQNISDVLNKGAELIVKPEEVRQVMLVYDAAMCSSETGEAVQF